MSLESVLSKLRGLRALSQSANQEEAETAARLAAELVHKHRIDEAEVSFSTGATEAINDDGVPLDTFGRNHVLWRRDLGLILAQEHGCAMYSALHPNSVEMKLVGRPSDVAAVRYLYAWLSADIARISGAYGKDKRSFCLGAVHGIHSALVRGRKAAEAGHGQAAIVLASRYDESVAWLKTARGDMKKASARHAAVSRAVYDRGYQHGQNVHIGDALPPAGATRALPQ